jgi:hypothetical protein
MRKGEKFFNSQSEFKIFKMVGYDAKNLSKTNLTNPYFHHIKDALLYLIDELNKKCIMSIEFIASLGETSSGTEIQTNRLLTDI